MASITLLGQALSTNNLYKHARNISYMSSAGRKLKEDYIKQVSAQWKKPPLTGDLYVEIILYFGDKRRRDFDNYHKLSFDSMSGIVYEDDVQIMKATILKAYDKENPRIEIILKKYNDKQKGKSKDTSHGHRNKPNPRPSVGAVGTERHI